MRPKKNGSMAKNRPEAETKNGQTTGATSLAP